MRNLTKSALVTIFCLTIMLIIFFPNPYTMILMILLFFGLPLFLGIYEYKRSKTKKQRLISVIIMLSPVLLCSIVYFYINIDQYFHWHIFPNQIEELLDAFGKNGAQAY